VNLARLSRWAPRSRVPLCLFALLALPATLTPSALSLLTDASALATPTIQTPYIRGVPHTDRTGAVRHSHDANASWFPIGLYHALSGTESGQQHGLETVAAAGFNTVFLWEGQSLTPALNEAHRLGLKTIIHHPDDATIAALSLESAALAPTVLAWYLDEEPSLHHPVVRQPELLAAFARRRDQIHRLDSVRPVFALDWPDFSGSRRASWIAWADAGDVSAHDNYPIRGRRFEGLDTMTGIPRSVALAAAATREQKPVWVLLQAMAGPGFGWRMPTPAEHRAMAYAALIHGATGLFQFALDSPVTRDGQILGIAPDPSAALPPLPQATASNRPPPLRANVGDLAASRTLWAAVTALNQELRTLTPDLLSPTATINYQVTVPGAGLVGAPVRTLLKDREGTLTLLAVNLERRPHKIDVTFPRPIAGGRRLFEAAPAPWTTGTATWHDLFPPLGVMIYQFHMK